MTDIRRDDHEPLYSHQVERDDLTRPGTAVCIDPECDVKMQPHSHKIGRTDAHGIDMLPELDNEDESDFDDLEAEEAYSRWKLDREDYD